MTQFGVLNAFAGIDTPVITGFTNNAGVGINVKVNGNVVVSMLGQHLTQETALDVIRVIQAAMSIVPTEEQVDLASAMLTLFATKSYVPQDEPQDNGADDLAEQNALDADIEAWQFEKAGVSL